MFSEKLFFLSKILVQFVWDCANQFCGTFTSRQTGEDLQEQNCTLDGPSKTNIHKFAEIKEIHKYNGENTREMNKKEMKIIYTVYGLKARI